MGMDDYSGMCSERRSGVDPPGPIMNKDILEVNVGTESAFIYSFSQSSGDRASPSVRSMKQMIITFFISFAGVSKGGSHPFSFHCPLLL